MRESDRHAVPDRIAIDAKGYGWRVWDDEEMWSMIPTNPDNSPIPRPVTWFVRSDEVERLCEALRLVLKAWGDEPQPGRSLFDALVNARVLLSTYAGKDIGTEIE